MPIGISSFCKRCEKIRPDGAYGKLLRGKPESRAVCTCVRDAKLKLAEKTNEETMWSPLSTPPVDFGDGMKPLNDYSVDPKTAKFSASHVTQLNQKQKTRSEGERNNGREIEKKFRVGTGVSLDMAARYLASLFPEAPTIHGESVDVFWRSPGVDFVRLRENTLELTIKITDKDDITDRVERNLKVVSYEEGLKWANAVFGKPVGHNRTQFHVFYLPNCEVTVYEVRGYPQVFLEIEASSLETVNNQEAALKSTIPLLQEFKSLFQILFGDK